MVWFSDSGQLIVPTPHKHFLIPSGGGPPPTDWGPGYDPARGAVPSGNAVLSGFQNIDSTNPTGDPGTGSGYVSACIVQTQTDEKRYVEFVVPGNVGPADYVGYAPIAFGFFTTSGPGGAGGGGAWYGSDGTLYAMGFAQAAGPAWSAGDRIGLAADTFIGAFFISFYHNGALVGGLTPFSNFGGWSAFSISSALNTYEIHTAASIEALPPGYQYMYP